MDERYAYWLAALVDGEGSIITRERATRPRPVIVLTIAQNDRRLLERATEYLGCGRIYGDIGPRKTGHQLQINKVADLRRVLTAIEPHLVLKQEKARDALAVLASYPAG